jgi:hypothetical protein
VSAEVKELEKQPAGSRRYLRELDDAVSALKKSGRRR